MSSECPTLRQAGLLALPGDATTLVRAVRSGLLLAGDDRGEAGLWAPDGTRRWQARGKAAAVRADIVPDGTRAAVSFADGEVLVVEDTGRAVTRLRGRPGAWPVLDPDSDRILLVHAASGAAELLGANGRRLREVRLPAPAAGIGFVARTGGLIVATKGGMVARVTTEGRLVWGGDLARPTTGLAVDADGREFWLALLARGAECLAADSGARLASFDSGRPIETVAVAAERVAFGCSDGALAVTDRRGLVILEGHAGRRATAVAIRDAGDEMFVACGDGPVRLFVAADPSKATSDAAGARPSVAACAQDASRRSFSVGSAPRRVVRVSPSGAALLVEDGPRALRTECVRGESRIEHTGALLDARIADDGSVLLVTTGDIRRVADGTVLQIARFALEPGVASISADGSMVAVADPTGRVRLLSLEDGLPRAAIALEGRRVATALAASHAAAAYETRDEGVFTFGDGWSRALTATPADGRLRLAAATGDGPLVVSERTVAVYAWTGLRRWGIAVPETPRGALPLEDGGVIVHLSGDAWVLDRGGRRTARFAVPPGVPAAASGTGRDLRIAVVDGRRLTLVAADGARVVQETFESPILAAAVAADGSVVACRLADRVVRLAPEPAPPTSLPGRGTP